MKYFPKVVAKISRAFGILKMKDSIVFINLSLSLSSNLVQNPQVTEQLQLICIYYFT